jgi:hypothetical protein
LDAPDQGVNQGLDRVVGLGPVEIKLTIPSSKGKMFLKSTEINGASISVAEEMGCLHITKHCAPLSPQSPLFKTRSTARETRHEEDLAMKS